VAHGTPNQRMEPTPASAAPHLGSTRWGSASGGVAPGTVTASARGAAFGGRHAPRQCLARLIREALARLGLDEERIVATSNSGSARACGARALALLSIIVAAIAAPAHQATATFDQPPMLLEYVEPVVADSLVAAVVDSTVLIRVSLDTTGAVVHAEVISGDSLLRPAAVAAVEAWTWSPGYGGWEPVPVTFVVPVRFYPSRPDWRGLWSPWFDSRRARADSVSGEAQTTRSRPN